MTRDVVLFLPCTAFQVRVEVSTPQVGTRIEELVLRAVAAGRRTIDTLVETFALGHRPMLQLVFDLWHRNLLLVDPTGGFLVLPPEVSEAIEADRTTGGGEWPRLRQLLGGEFTAREEELLFEPLTGNVLVEDGLRKPGSADTVVPVGANGQEYKQVPHYKLLRALEQRMEQLSREQRTDVRIQRVYHRFTVPEGPGADSARRFLRIQADVSIDRETRLLSFHIRKPEYLDSVIRREIEGALSTLAEAHPGHAFFARVREQATQLDERDPLSPDNAVAALMAAVRDLDGVDQGTLPHHHLRLNAITRDAIAVVARDMGPDASVQVVCGVEDHRKAVLAMLDTARRQVVFVSPWVDREAMEWLWDDLTRVMRRGVEVFVIWGIEEYERLGDRSRGLDRAVLELCERFPDQFSISLAPARTHAKIIVADDQAALVTSWNVLSSRSLGTLEIGLGARCVSGGLPLARDLLAWAREAYPEYDVACRIRTTSPEFRQSTAWASSQALNVPERPDRVLEAIDDPGLLASSFSLWRLQWRQTAGELASQLGALGLTGTVVRDGVHRRVMWRALDEAEDRLLITSDRLTSDVVDTRFLAALRSALARGVQIALAYQRTDDDMEADIAPEDRPLARLELLAREHPGQMKVCQGRTHAKVLVVDDRLLVTSFNFLSFRGSYSTVRHRRLKSEVGVYLREPALSDRLVEEVLGSGLPRREPRKVAANPTLGDGRGTRPPAGLHDLIAAAGVADLKEREGRVRAWYRELDDPAGALDTLRILGGVRLPSDALDLCVRATLADPRAWGLPERDRWVDWLAAQWWRSKRWIETLVLVSALRDPAARGRGTPSLRLAEVMATREIPSRRAAALEVAALAEPRREEELRALAAASMLGILRDGEPAAGECLDLLMDGLDPTTQAWADAVRNWWEATYLPVPLAHVHRAVARTEVAEERQSAHREVTRLLAELCQTKLDFAFGKRVLQKAWLSERGLFGTIRAEFAAGRDGALRAWLQEAGVEDVTGSAVERALGDWLDIAALRAAENTQFAGDVIAGARRTWMIRRIAKVARAGQVWRSSAPDEAEPLDPATVLALRALAATLRSQEGRMLELRLAADRGGTCDAPILGELDDTTLPLRRWGGP